MDHEIREVYNEDTIGRRWHPPIMTAKKLRIKKEKSEVIEMNPNKPMKVKEFKKLSDKSKIEYITALVEKYNANIKALYTMLGCSRTWFHANVTKPLGLSKLFSVGRAMSFEDQLKWNDFVNETDEACENLSENIVENTENQNSVDEFRCDELPKMEVINANFTASGVFDAQRFVDILKNYITEGTYCEIAVSIDTTVIKPISPLN